LNHEEHEEHEGKVKNRDKGAKVQRHKENIVKNFMNFMLFMVRNISENSC